MKLTNLKTARLERTEVEKLHVQRFVFDFDLSIENENRNVSFLCLFKHVVPSGNFQRSDDDRIDALGNE